MSKKKIDKDTEYTKEQLIFSRRYISKRDVLTSILEDGKHYSLEEVDELINKFMKGKVI